MAAAVETRYPRAGGYPVSSSDESNMGTASTYTHVRPNMIRRETDQILSYYQSEHAGRSISGSTPYDDNREQEQQPVLKRRDSSASSKSSSEYSAESLDRHEASTPAEHSGPQPVRHSQHTRRPSVPSQESVDRRRLAIVEVDPTLPPSITRKGSGRAKASEYIPSVSVSSSALLSRRGIQVNGLALVAPPDASPSTYTDLTPPPTAPLITTDRSWNTASSSGGHHHSRSASEAVGAWGKSPKSSRDIGIVGLGSVQALSNKQTKVVVRRSVHPSQTQGDTLEVPIFQTPTKSRSPSPAAHTPELSDSTMSSMDYSLQITPTNLIRSDRDQTRTPAIGEGKDIGQPVIGPVVVGLESDQIRRIGLQATESGLASPSSAYSSLSSSSSPYLSYQPGVHSTAGPLPPPPALDGDKVPASGPPPRPPRTMRTPLPGASPSLGAPKRDLEALKESLQLPKSVAHVLASRSNSRLDTAQDGSDVSTRPQEDSDVENRPPEPVASHRSRSIHRREGAFPPSDASASTPETSPQIDLSEPEGVIRQISTIAAPPPAQSPVRESVSADYDVIDEDSDRDRASGWRLHREASWVSLKQEVNRASSPNGKPQVMGRRSSSGSLSPLPPPKTGRGIGLEDARPLPTPNTTSNPFKATLVNLKRFSALPRTPSQLSLRSRPASIDHSSRTPSPPPISTPKITIQRRVVNPWPDAMQYHDVHALKTTKERSIVYARKIKEFSLYESGLRDWVIATQSKRPTGSRSARNSPARSGMGSLLTAGDPTPIPRHVSGGSVGSEMTFPTRSDAYQATELSMRPEDDLSSTKSPPSYLPYPSLAGSPSRSANMLQSNARTYQVPLSSGSSRTGTGFFASIGRKASLKKDRGLTMSSVSPRVLTKRLPTSNTPRPVQLHNSPSIPGGPRAAPGRVTRSQTISVAPSGPVAHLQEQQPTKLTRSETHRQSLSGRRASLFHRSTVPVPVQQPPAVASTPEFEEQVDRLAELLPHAERKVLAGYLRRAGQDILAIGQYLEDEKNGTLRYD